MNPKPSLWHSRLNMNRHSTYGGQEGKTNPSDKMDIWYYLHLQEGSFLVVENVIEQKNGKVICNVSESSMHFRCLHVFGGQGIVREINEKKRLKKEKKKKMRFGKPVASI